MLSAMNLSLVAKRCELVATRFRLFATGWSRTACLLVAVLDRFSMYPSSFLNNPVGSTGRFISTVVLLRWVAALALPN